MNKISPSSIFRKASWRRRLLLSCRVQAFGPLSRIYGLLGIDTQTSLMIIGISGALSIIYCTIGLWALDRVGRIKPLIVSAAGCALALLVNAVLSQHLLGASSNQLRAMVAMNFVFSLFHTPTGIISWVYPAGIFPVDILARANSISTFTNWTLNLGFAHITPVALTAIGFKFFYAFFVLGVVATVCCAMFYPETKGRTLEQMDGLLRDQLVPHALEDPEAAAAAMCKSAVFSEHVEVPEKQGGNGGA